MTMQITDEMVEQALDAWYSNEEIFSDNAKAMRAALEAALGDMIEECAQAIERPYLFVVAIATGITVILRMHLT